MLAMVRNLGVTMMAIALAGTALAQDAQRETRLGAESFESPPASLEQLDWLVGQWSGEGIQGAQAMESWLPPIGGTMVGTFVQETDGGAIMFTEHMYIVAEGDSLALKLKHFNADLTGWEEKDDMLTFRLVAIEECAVYFNALTLRCADADMPGEGLVAAVRMQSGEELAFQFRPAKFKSQFDCSDSETTLDINQCFLLAAQNAQTRRNFYFRAAQERAEGDAQILAKMQESYARFETYVEAECGAVYQYWIEGSIRNAKALECRIELEDARAEAIWRNWLTYPDSTPPDLPRPRPTL